MAALRRKESDLRVKGLGLGPRFVLAMTGALTLVLAAAAAVLYGGATTIADNVRTETISEAVRLTRTDPDYMPGNQGIQHPNGVKILPFQYIEEDVKRSGTLYRDEGMVDDPSDDFEVLVPEEKDLGRALLGMIVAIMVVVVLVGAGVTLWVANQVTRPVRTIIEDVRQIAKGDLTHKTSAVGTGEIELLARAINRMTRDLDQAQGAQLELSVRERELDLASGVREALLPLTTPLVDGYDIGAAFINSPHFGGDFHDFIEREDGCVGLLVCDVSGRGVPAALVGATARSYLRTELLRTEDVLASFRRVNRWLVGDVRRGMFVTALYALVDPLRRTCTVYCAGHKIPLIRHCASTEELRVVHPEGIALGFDKGPVFDRTLEAVEIEFEVGDRLVLTNSAPVAIKSAEGRELGEKGFYLRAKRHAHLETHAFLKSMRRELLQFAGEGEWDDVSLVTISRQS